MYTPKQQTKHTFRNFLLFSTLIILLNVYGESLNDDGFEAVKAFLGFHHNLSQIDCETISLGIRNAVQDDRVQMEGSRAVVLFTEEENAIYLDPSKDINYLGNLILNYLKDKETVFNCYFGVYTYAMRDTPFLQYINFSNDTIYMKYFYHEVNFELTLNINSEANLELQRITIDGPTKNGHLYSKTTYDMSSEELKNLDVSESLGDIGQEALVYIKEQVAGFKTFQYFLEKAGVSSETQELFETVQPLLK